MPLTLADRVRDTTTTTGTGTVTLSGTAPTGYQNFSVIGNGNTTYYTINAGSQWEVGIGTYSSTGPTLSRDTVLESSNGGALVNFSAGVKDVFVTYPSDKSVIQDGATITAGTAVLGVANGGTGLSSTPANGAIDIGNGTGFTRTTLTAGTNISITNGAGSITINATDQFVGTVTSVAASGGTTGMTFSGSPITTSGTLTLGGTLGVANGGTGATTLSSGYLLKGNGTSAVSASVIYDDGTNVGIGTSSPGMPLDVQSNASALGIRVRGRAADNFGFFQFSSNNLASSTYIGSNGSLLQFETGGSERMRIDNSGNLLVGTTTAVDNNFPLELNAGASGLRGMGVNNNGGYGVYLTYDNTGRYGSGGAAIRNIANSPLAFETNNTERMRIDSSGNLLVGTTSALLPGSGRGNITLNGSSDAILTLGVGGSSRGWLYSNLAATYLASAAPLIFEAGGANERMRITSTGEVGVGTSAPSGLIEAFGTDASIIVHNSGNSRGGIAALSTQRVAFTSTSVSDDLVFGYAASPITSASFVERMRIDNGTGAVTANVDIRAPIFYDSNNTGFYVDPASGTNLNGTFVNNGGTVMSGGWNRNAMLTSTFPVLVFNSNNTKYSGIGSDYSTPSAGFWFWVNGSSSDISGTGSVAMRITQGGWVEAPSSFRAPIFYDSDNTAYYLDPNTTGLALRTAGYWQQDSTAWAGDINGKIQYHGNNWYFNSANEWIFRASSGAQPFYVTQSGVAIASGDMRAPIFYDLNNTGFYTDPASTSVMSNAIINGRAMTFAMYYEGFTLDANTMQSNATGFTYSVNAPYTGPIARFSTGGGYDLWLNAPYWGGGGLVFRTRNGDLGTLNAWQSVAVYGQNGGGSLYATILYDGNDTNYYVDPASTSITNIVRANSIQFSNGNTAITLTDSSYQILRDPTGAVALYLGGADPANYYDNTNHNFRARGGSQYGTINANGMYAPAFYDYNNSAYYVNPNGSSALAGALLIGPTSGGAYTRFGAGAGDTTYSTISASNGNLHIDSQAGYDLYLNWYTARPVWSEGGAYFPIYYDRNNTGYYVDPAGTSFILGNFYVARNGNSNDTFGGLEMRENSYQGAGTGAATEAPGINFHWSMRAAARLYMDAGGNFVLGGQSDITNNRRSLSLNELFAVNQVRGSIFYDSGNTAFYLDPASTSRLNQAQFVNRISIGDGNGTPFLNTGSPGVWLSYNGGTDIFMGSETSTVVGFYVAGAWRFRVNSSGDATATGNVTAYSDARIKKDIETIDGALELVSKMRGVRYTRIDTENRNVGVIAQEMLEVLPEVVQQGVGDDDTLSVAYGNLVGVLIEAIKELRAEVAELKGK